jgi:phage protein D
MPEPTLQQVRDAPSFKVFVRGRELPPETAVDVLEVCVSEYVEGASAFTLTLNNWASDKQELKWVDGDLLAEGVEIDVRVGFVDNLKSLIVGEVTALEPEFHEGEAPTLKVQGYDLLHRFRRGRKTRSFLNVSDSQIAQQIAGELGLGAQIEDSSVVHEYVLQHNQTDIDFLLRRARLIDFELLVEDRDLVFRPTPNDRAKVVTLEYGLTLKSFYPRLSTLQQVSEVVVRGWDLRTKQAIVAQARQGDERSMMSGTRLGVAIAEQAFFATEDLIADTPVASVGEANQIARGRFNDMTLQFVSGEGTAIGNTDIRAGRVVELTKLGKRFSGPYYVTSSTHAVGPSGYTTRFTVARSAT